MVLGARACRLSQGTHKLQRSPGGSWDELSTARTLPRQGPPQQQLTAVQQPARIWGWCLVPIQFTKLSPIAATTRPLGSAARFGMPNLAALPKGRVVVTIGDNFVNCPAPSSCRASHVDT